MAINLKQISSSDSDNVKLDKINYNFDQLIMNGGGPMGYQGIKGDQGPQGITGPVGAQGSIGATGVQGPVGASAATLWKSIQGDASALTADTILPVHNSSTSSVYPPVISIGFLDIDPEYNAAQSISGGNVPYQWIINRRNNFKTNLRFTNDIATSFFDFTMTNIGGTNATFTMGFDTVSPGTEIQWYAETHVFIDNTSSSVLMQMDAGSILYNIPTTFSDGAIFQDSLTITHASAAQDKIAVAVNTTGDIEFKTPQEIGGAVPFGTIVSILPLAYTNNFTQSETVDISTSPANENPLPITVGSGTGDYEGWYLCNGRTWTDGTNSYPTDDMNSFGYSIEANTVGTGANPQTLQSLTNTSTSVIGGANADAGASQPTTPGIYDVTGSAVTTGSAFAAGSGTSTIIIKQIPQIIYLGVSGLYWSEN